MRVMPEVDKEYKTSQGYKVVVKGVDGSWIWYRRNKTGEHGQVSLSTWELWDWTEVKPVVPLPEHWVVRYGLSGHSTFLDRNEAMSRAMWLIDGGREQVHVVHVWSDESGDHATVERVAK